MALRGRRGQEIRFRAIRVKVAGLWVQGFRVERLGLQTLNPKPEIHNPKPLGALVGGGWTMYLGSEHLDPKYRPKSALFRYVDPWGFGCRVMSSFLQTHSRQAWWSNVKAIPTLGLRLRKPKPQILKPKQPRSHKSKNSKKSP